MEELPQINESVRVDANSIRIEANVYRDLKGSYRVRFEYSSSEDWGWFNSGRSDISGGDDLPLENADRTEIIEKIKKYIRLNI
jgi:hypothetical protein